MDPSYVVDWLSLLLRWFHFVAGIAWIGASFYFVWLNNTVRPVPDPEGRLAGGLFAIHGGAFYEVRKYKGAPGTLPETLHWFKWEAYLTGISGLLLLALLYWHQPTLMMVRDGGPLGGAASVAAGAGALLAAWLLYDGLCRSPLRHRPLDLALGVALLVAGLTAALAWALSPRAAFLHAGAAMGLIMVLNVFFVIIPGQRAMVDALVKGEPPPLDRGLAGATRSLHNNYFTLPVLFVMVSHHFPIIVGHRAAPILLLGLFVCSVLVKHWMNLHEQQRRPGPHWLVGAALGVLGLAFVARPTPPPPASQAPGPPWSAVAGIFEERCAPCHSAIPTFPGMLAPPRGFVVDNPSTLRISANLIRAQVVTAPIMPLGNVTKMTAEERALIGRWLDGGAKVD